MMMTNIAHTCALIKKRTVSRLEIASFGDFGQHLHNWPHVAHKTAVYEHSANIEELELELKLAQHENDQI